MQASNSDILVAIKSCERDALNGANQAIRETWGHDLATFFIGKTNIVLRPDEVSLDCPDDYLSLPLKTKAILRYAKDFEHVFLADTDTFVVLDRLLASGFDKYDLIGHLGGNLEGGRYYPWPSGGAGYWLSRRAAQIIVDAPENPEWAEDRLVGQILGPYIERGELKSFHHQGYCSEQVNGEWIGDVTCHYGGRGMNREYNPKWMYAKYGQRDVRPTI